MSKKSKSKIKKNKKVKYNNVLDKYLKLTTRIDANIETLLLTYDSYLYKREIYSLDEIIAMSDMTDIDDVMRRAIIEDFSNDVEDVDVVDVVSILKDLLIDNFVIVFESIETLANNISKERIKYYQLEDEFGELYSSFNYFIENFRYHLAGLLDEDLNKNNSFYLLGRGMIEKVLADVQLMLISIIEKSY